MDALATKRDLSESNHIKVLEPGYRICVSCVMDTTDPDISFDSLGVCNHCHKFMMTLSSRLNSDPNGLDNLVETIKNRARNSEYDAIVGLSGGVDSAYLSLLAKRSGLRLLAVHVDNGWNSEISVRNISSLVNSLGIDLYTEILDWDEFSRIQKTFLYSGVPDVEVPTDHSIYAVLLREAVDRGIPSVLHGMNFATEGVMSDSWAYGHSDWTYIRDVCLRAGGFVPESYPHYSLYSLFRDLILRGIKLVGLLNYLPYERGSAEALLRKELSWKSYGGKHSESVYTRFVQDEYLPRRFRIDKRRAHLSSAILSGEISREYALSEIAKPRLFDSSDREFVLKKLNMTQKEYSALLVAPKRSYRHFKNSRWQIKVLKDLHNMLRRSGVLSK